jgi:hypothetical protein
MAAIARGYGATANVSCRGFFFVTVLQTHSSFLPSSFLGRQDQGFAFTPFQPPRWYRASHPYTGASHPYTVDPKNAGHLPS